MAPAIVWKDIIIKALRFFLKGFIYITNIFCNVQIQGRIDAILDLYTREEPGDKINC